MNWKFTRKDHVAWFRRGEPICTLLPFPRSYLTRFDPVIRPSAANPELEKDHRVWCDSRANFNRDLNIAESEAQKQRWQKAYMLGMDAKQQPFAEHETKLALPAFRSESER